MRLSFSAGLSPCPAWYWLITLLLGHGATVNFQSLKLLSPPDTAEVGLNIRVMWPFCLLFSVRCPKIFILGLPPGQGHPSLSTGAWRGFPCQPLGNSALVRSLPYFNHYQWQSTITGFLCTIFFLLIYQWRKHWRIVLANGHSWRT